jgi:hypothetical protein
MRISRTRAEDFFSCMALATAIMVNHSLILGYKLEYHHWMYFGNIFVFLLAVSRLGAWAGRSRRWVLASGLLALAAFLQGVCYAAIHFPFQGIPKDYDDALCWLQKNTRRDDVVLSLNPEVNGLIPAFTQDKVFFAVGMPHVSDYPSLANSERLFAALGFFGVDRERFIREVLFAPSLYGRRDLVATGLKRGEIERPELYNLLFYGSSASFMRPIIMQAEARAPQACSGEWLAGVEFPVSPPDYVWVGPWEREYAGRCFSPGREVYRNHSVVLYRYPGR